MNDVPYIVHESAQARQERTIKRLWILCLVMFLAFAGSNAAWIYYESQFETVTTQIEADQQADRDGSNYIIGGDYGQTEGQDQNNETNPQNGWE